MDTQQVLTDQNQFAHVRVVLSMIVGLALARLLSGLAGLVQHPRRMRVDARHLLWSAFMLVLLIHFWWWQFSLIHIPKWHFGMYAFVISYASILYLLCALLFPDDLVEFSGYRGYFEAKRVWFFSVLGFVMLLDIADTYLKGPAHWQAHSPQIWWRTLVGLALCALAAWVRPLRLQIALGALGIASQVAWIAYLYNALE